MRTDYNNWQPYSVEHLHKIFKEADFPWGIAGGWAIDLYIGSQTRQHNDIDIMILNCDFQKIFAYLCRFTIYTAKDGELSIWDGQRLDDSYSLWVSEDDNSPFRFQIMLIEVNEDKWLYKRNNEIQGNLNSLFIKSVEEIPIISPEIQMLYKLDSDCVRPKDLEDFKAIKDHLNVRQKNWLMNYLSFNYSHQGD
ncbi:nucleotidyltransferase domain-containing protein [Macrococcus brunensis]|uniref:nucleotidyltransferase domain-containing protein n=1 Tax=Macrococcus brunensis TaxID=198483 RepID=UPI001EF0708C|nr:hypothetical protein [Macrococcus brunensis]ULG74562.1 hypothetical protein MGG13_01975 [Macrococcus brunensis]